MGCGKAEGFTDCCIPDKIDDSVGSIKGVDCNSGGIGRCPRTIQNSNRIEVFLLKCVGSVWSYTFCSVPAEENRVAGLAVCFERASAEGRVSTSIE